MTAGKGSAEDSGVKTYRRTPIVVEAIRISKTNLKEACEFVFSDKRFAGGVIQNENRDGYYVRFDSPYKCGYAREGDYIIKDSEGRLYPCEADVFKATYEEVK